jgi:ferredoxin-NADP reductase/mono/diheme cytochrome c family protein
VRVFSVLPASLSSVLGILFILLGAAAVWLMFHASRRAQSPTARERVLRAHRIAGYLFISLFCFMTWFMILRARSGPDELPIPSMLHILLAMILAPLLLVKVLIARYYKSFTAALVPLGLTIFTLGFVLIATTAGPYLLRKATVKDISLQAIDMGAARVDLPASEALMQKRCSRCHSLERIIGARKDARAWLATINRMRALPGSGIPEADAKIILSYLISEDSVDSSNAQGELAVGRALVDSHCNRCHALERIYQSAKSPAEWKATVTRMVAYARGAEGFFKPGEDERIIQFLSATQNPEGFVSGPDSKRDGKPLTKEEEPAGRADDPVSSVPTVGVTALIAAAFGTLMWRRPKSFSSAATNGSANHPATARVEAALASGARRQVILQLVRTERQTQDCLSLRFRVAGREAFRGKPGQFLTFDWLIDGQKLVRSYSISSSPTQAGFVEITVKKNPQGRVSAFLNERIPPNLTVEARGPSGRFCFNEAEHKRIVLLAGGSGITPMISMLRYIDDLCLDTKVTLFYSVRTQQDIIFERELERLVRCLPNFHRVIVVTKPEHGWSGRTGRLTREMITEELAEIKEQAFFLCGPAAFMDHVNGILLSLGVDPQRIVRERFGGKSVTAQMEPETQAPGGVIEFAKSGKTSTLPASRTLLEAAEMNGISIPYSCRQGQCGTCATRLLEGEIAMDCEDGLDPALKAQGYVLTCVARGQGNVRLDA